MEISEKPMFRCQVVGCNIKSDRTFRIPSPKNSYERYKAFITAMGNPKFLKMPYEELLSKRICHRHFRKEDFYSGTHFLRASAVPTRHLPESQSLLNDTTKKKDKFIRDKGIKQTIANLPKSKTGIIGHIPEVIDLTEPTVSKQVEEEHDYCNNADDDQIEVFVLDQTDFMNLPESLFEPSVRSPERDNEKRVGNQDKMEEIVVTDSLVQFLNDIKKGTNPSFIEPADPLKLPEPKRKSSNLPIPLEMSEQHLNKTRKTNCAPTHNGQLLGRGTNPSFIELPPLKLLEFPLKLPEPKTPEPKRKRKTPIPLEILEGYLNKTRKKNGQLLIREINASSAEATDPLEIPEQNLKKTTNNIFTPTPPKSDLLRKVLNVPPSTKPTDVLKLPEPTREGNNMQIPHKANYQSSNRLRNQEKLQNGTLNKSQVQIHNNTSYSKNKQNCRICLNPLENSVCTKLFDGLNQEESARLRDKIEYVMADKMNFGATRDPAICKKCEDLIKVNYVFKKQLSRVEKEVSTPVNNDGNQKSIVILDTVEDVPRDGVASKTNVDIVEKRRQISTKPVERASNNLENNKIIVRRTPLSNFKGIQEKTPESLRISKLYEEYKKNTLKSRNVAENTTQKSPSRILEISTKSNLYCMESDKSLEEYLLKRKEYVKKMLPDNTAPKPSTTPKTHSTVQLKMLEEQTLRNRRYGRVYHSDNSQINQVNFETYLVDKSNLIGHGITDLNVYLTLRREKQERFKRTPQYRSMQNRPSKHSLKTVQNANATEQKQNTVTEVTPNPPEINCASIREEDLAGNNIEIHIENDRNTGNDVAKSKSRPEEEGNKVMMKYGLYSKKVVPPQVVGVVDNDRNTRNDVAKSKSQPEEEGNKVMIKYGLCSKKLVPPQVVGAVDNDQNTGKDVAILKSLLLEGSNKVTKKYGLCDKKAVSLEEEVTGTMTTESRSQAAYNYLFQLDGRKKKKKPAVPPTWNLFDKEHDKYFENLEGEPGCFMVRKWKRWARRIPVLEGPILLCETCGKVCQQNKFSQHRQEHRDAKPFMCSYCGELFSRRLILNDHIARKHEPPKFKCPKCGRKFHIKHDLSSHMSVKHSDKSAEHQCPICGKMIHKYYYMSHVKAHDPSITYTCDVCGMKFRTAPSKSIHRKKHFAPKNHQCPYCKKLIMYEHNLKTHIQIFHEGTSKWKCNICNQGFYAGVKLKRHLIAMHSSNASRKRRIRNKMVTDEVKECEKAVASIESRVQVEKVLVLEENENEMIYRNVNDDVLDVLVKTCNIQE